MRHKGIIALLLEKRDYKIQAGGYYSILNAASSAGNFEVVVDLLRKAGVTYSYSGSETAPVVPTCEPDKDLREQIFPQGNNWKLSRALVSAVAYGSYELAKVLLLSGADVNYSPRVCPFLKRSNQRRFDDDDLDFSLAVAAEDGNIDILNLLLDRGAAIDLDTGRGCALSAAAHAQSLSAINLLLDRGANINQLNNHYGCPVSAAIISDEWLNINPAFDLLVERGANLDPPGILDQYRPLVVAIGTDSFDIIERILESGVDIDVTIEGQSIKQYATSRCMWVVVDILLTHRPGATFEVDDYYGSPLSAALSESIDPDEIWIVEMLIRHGADPNAIGGRYGCPLAAGAWNFNLNSLKLLLDHGADVNLKAGIYGCPLISAVLRGQLEVVRLFLERGANVNLEAESGEYSTPLNAANTFLEWAAAKAVEEIETGEIIKQLLIDSGAE